MKKVSLLILMSLFILLVFASCKLLPGNNGGDDQGEPECEHQWTEATCTAPQLCSLCGERKGSLIPHNLVDATCTEAKTCTMCHQTWGDPLGHRWSAGSCTAARTCKTCQAVEGEAPGHDYADATCDTPLTCRLCSATEGDPLGHNYVPVVTKATCTADGYTTYTCATCKDSYVDEITTALGHLNDVELPAKDATCTEDGCTAGIRCSRCETDTTAQIVIEALGHKSVSNVVAPTCTADGYTEYTCSVCGDYHTGNVVPALGHDYGDAACGTVASCGREGCEDADSAKPIEHDFAPATCTEPATCKRGCGATEGEPLGHNMSEANCLAPSTCLNKCGLVEGDKDAHVLYFTYLQNAPHYICKLCASTFKLDNFLYINGDGYNDLTPGDNANKGYITVEGTNNPIIVEDENGNKYYEALKKETTEGAGQVQFWIPREEKTKVDFSANNASAGVFSFKLNAFFDTNFGMRLIDGSAPADRWSAEWAIQENIFTIYPAAKNEETGETYVEIIGLNKSSLKKIAVTEESPFTGWIDVIIGIELDSDSDTITLHYYIDGEYLGSQSQPNTIITKSVNCIYVNGNSKVGGSGIMFDDIVFGYTEAGYWCFDGHVHDWTATETVDPDCIHDGYTIYKCSLGCTRRDDFKSPLGHVTEDFPELLPTCIDDGYTAGKLCTVCGAVTEGKDVLTAPGHSYTSEVTVPTCTTEGYTTYTCSVCSFVTIGDEVEALGHDFANAKCSEPGVCEREGCGFSSGDEPIGHDYAPATCTTPATCKRADCGETTGDPIPHDMLPSNCISASVCSYGCGHTEGDIGTHVLTLKYVSAKVTFVCSACEVSYTLEDSMYIDGKNHNNLAGAANAGHYTVAEGTQNPLIVDGHYELLNKSGKRGQVQLWIPTSNPHTNLAGFTCENNAVGFLSFKVNAYATEKEGLSFKILDSTNRNSGFSWPKHSADIFKLEKATTANGVTTTVINGYGGKTITTITSDDKFTGWLDVAIGIKLDATANQITLHYYINGKIVTTYSAEMSIVTGKIDSVYLTGYTSELGSGVMLDDIAFGYTANGEWMFDDCDHSYEGTVVAPTCTKEGYTQLYCSVCGHRDVSDIVDPLGHTGGKANCTDSPKCDVCGESYGEALGHSGGKATCTVQATCNVCGVPYGDLAPHTPKDPICLSDTVCADCEAPLTMSTHSLTAVKEKGQLYCKCVQCEQNFVMDKYYYFDGSDSTMKDFFSQDEGNAYNGDKSGIEIIAGQYAYLHDDNDISGKAVVWIPKNTSGESYFNDFNTANNSIGVISFKVNAYMTSHLGVAFVDTTLRGTNDYWQTGAIATDFFKINAPQGNVVSVTGWNGELMQINVTDEDKWTGWLDVTVGIELSEANDSITIYYYINGQYLGSATKEMIITSNKIDGIYFSGISAKAGTGYILDDVGFGYTTKGEWIFDK